MMSSPLSELLKFSVSAFVAIALLAGCGESTAPDSQSSEGGDSTSHGSFRNPIGPQGGYVRDPLALPQPPIIPPLTDEQVQDTPDPFITYYGGFYYMTYTATPLEIRRSATLAGLADAEEYLVWPQPGDEVPTGSNIFTWAPELHRLNSPEDGQFHWYLYYSPGDPQNKRMAVLESLTDDPLGRYRFKAFIPFAETCDTVLCFLRGGSLDATVYSHTNGKLYYFFSALRPSIPTPPESRLFVAEMENPWTLRSKPLQIASPVFDWERQGFVPTVEGPAVIRTHGKLHVVYSASFCGTDEYKLGRLTVPETANLLDPATWASAKNPQPIFVSAPEYGVYGPGHHGFFKSPDGTEDWIVYHAYTGRQGTRDSGGACNGGYRTARAQRFTFDADGNPQLGQPASPGVDVAAPSGDGSRTYQFEDAVVQSASRTIQQVVGGELTDRGDPHLVGFRALEFAGDLGDFIRFQLPAVEAGRRRLHVRVKAGPDRGAFELRIGPAGTANLRVLGIGDTYASKAGPLDLDLGPVDFDGGGLTLEFRNLRSPQATANTAVTLDQLRLEDAHE